MNRSTFNILIFSLPLLFTYCSNEPDLSNSWIEYATFDDYAHTNRQEVKEDTLYTSFTSQENPLILQIKTQSSEGSSPRFFKTINDGERMEITAEVPPGGLYVHDNGASRHVKEIEIMIPDNLFTAGDLIKYETILGSKDGTLSEEIFVVIAK